MNHLHQLMADRLNTASINPVEEESQLWNCFQLGDKVAFRKIYEIYINKLYSYGLKVCKDSTLVKDCIQDLFIDLWTKRERLSRTVQIEYYLYTSLRRKILSRLKSDRKLHIKLQQHISDEDVQVKSIENTIISDIRKTELQTAVSSALKKLPDRQREILFLIFEKGYSYEESSTLMNVDIKTAYNLAWRAMKKLKSVLC